LHVDRHVDSRLRDQIRDLIAEGTTSDEIAARLGISKQRVAAVKAHMTMGHYNLALLEQLTATARTGDPSARAAAKAEAERQFGEAISDMDGLMPAIRAIGAATRPDLIEELPPYPAAKSGVLGRHIHMRRVEIGLKRKELADRAQLSYQYVSAIENGAKDPSLVAVVRIADALELTLFELTSYSALVPSTAPGEPGPAPPTEVGPDPGEELNGVRSAAVVEDTSTSTPSPGELQTLITESVTTALGVWARIELPQLVAAALGRTP
jgi:transcriptional regulator with XRE-family HTH domain